MHLRPQVGEIVDRAQKEEKMEQALNKLRETWSRVEFQFIQFKDTQVCGGEGLCSSCVHARHLDT
jgi:hypothetical protein